MKTELKNAITKLAKAAADAKSPGEAMHRSQAALNLAHALVMLSAQDELAGDWPNDVAAAAGGMTQRAIER